MLIRMRAIQNVCNIPVPEVEMPWKMPPASSRKTNLLGWHHVFQFRGWWFKDLRRNSLMGSSCLYIYIYVDFLLRHELHGKHEICWCFNSQLWSSLRLSNSKFSYNHFVFVFKKFFWHFLKIFILNCFFLFFLF
jgi:hypothetical protein